MTELASEAEALHKLQMWKSEDLKKKDVELSDVIRSSERNTALVESLKDGNSKLALTQHFNPKL